MKNTFKILFSCIAAVIGICCATQAQTWNPVGVPGFSAGLENWSSIAINGSGTPYVAFQDNGNGGKATVMKYNGSSWVNVGTPGFSADLAPYTSLAINSAGIPYVVYQDAANSNFATVMKYNGSSWVTVGSAGFSAGQADFTSIAIGANDTPFVVYEDNVHGGRATVMKFNGFNWVTVGSAGFSVGTANYCTITMNSGGTPFVAFNDAGTANKATVMKFNGSSWVNVGSPGFSASTAYYTSIAVDGSGTPFVVYQDMAYSAGLATVMKYNGASWVSVGSPGFSSGVATYNSIAINSSGTPYVAFVNNIGGSFGDSATVMKYNGSSWVNVGGTEISAGTAGYTSIAINSAGTPFVAYEDYINAYKVTVMEFCSPTSLAPVTGPTTVCPGSTITLADVTTGGTWSSANTAIATVGSTGIVTGVSAGNVLISYTVTNSCGTTSSLAYITVGQRIITTIAGGGSTLGDGGQATAALLNGANGTFVDASGNIYIAEYGSSRIRKINTAGIISTVAGNGTLGYSGDGGPATNAQISGPSSVFVDAAGNIYIPDYNNNRIRKVNTAGVISTIAGNGTPGYTGDGGPATAGTTELYLPSYVFVDSIGTVYFTDGGNNVVRKITPAGIINTIAGTGLAGFSGDGGPATSAQLNQVYGITMDKAGNIYLGDHTNNCIRKINTSGMIATIAGNGTPGYTGDGGVATSAQLNVPNVVAIDPAGNIIIADRNNNVIRMINSSGIISTIAGSGTAGFSGDGGAALLAKLHFPSDVAMDAFGNIYIADYSNNRIRKIAPVSTAINATSTTICQGVPVMFTNATNGGTWSSSNPSVATVGSATGIVTGIAAGTATITYSFAFSCGSSFATLPITVNAFSAGTISGPAIVCPGNTITLTDAATGGAWSSSNTAAGTVTASGIFTGIAAGYTVVSYTISGGCGTLAARQLVTVGSPVITTIAGTGAAGSAGDGLQATAAQLQGPNGTVIDGAGNMYVCDYYNNRIRKISASGIISTVAGTGTVGYSGDGGQATAARIQSPSGIAVDPSGNILWAEYLNSVIRKLNVSTGVISTIAGVGFGSFSGDGGPATAARLNHPPNVIVDAAGIIYISDAGNQRIRKIDLTGIITTIAGTGTSGYSGDGGPATAAKTADVYGMCFDASGNMYLADQTNHRIRKIDQFGIISTILGTGVPGSSPDGTIATAANINQPTGVVADAAGNIDVVDRANNCVRQINTQTGIVNTLVNSSLIAGFTGDGGAPAAAELNNVPLIYFDVAGNMYISDFANNRIRKIAPVNNSVAAITGTSTVCVGSAVTLTDVTSGGTWSSSLPAIASVGTSGIVTGVSAGTATITYSVVYNCGTITAVLPVTVNPLPATPAAITGPTSICLGTPVTLGNTVAGGIWSSTVPSVATIGSASALLTGITAGVTTISYTIFNSCGANSVFRADTVVIPPAPITGNLSVCIGTTSLLSNSVSGGTWTSSSPAIATINALSGLVTPLAPGITTISYTTGGVCSATAIVTVNTTPAAITPATPVSICVGATTSLGEITTGGVWSSASPAIATVGATGIVTGIAAGTVNISYTTAGSCSVLKVVTVLATPAALSPASATVCTGNTTTLTETIAGGIWASSLPAVASVAGGIVTGNTVGIATISYSIGTCFVTAPVTVNLSPSAGIISGASAICTGSTATYTDPSTGGVWSISNPLLASVSPIGLLTAISAGSVTVSYTVTNGCGTVVATKAVTISSAATAGTIIGTTLVCAGTSTTLIDTTVGGVWSASNSHATITAAGVLTGMIPGTDTITYTVTNTCGVATTRTIISVGLFLTAGTISGPGIVCTGSAITLTDPVTGGLWSSTNSSASVSGGIVTGLAAGIDTIKYTVTSGCGAAVAMQVVTVNPSPVSGIITGPSILCAGVAALYTDTNTGGTWSCTNASASIDASGLLTAVLPGNDTIHYSVTNSCGTSVATAYISIGTAITSGVISGPGAVCVGASIALTDAAAGGVWGVTNGNATIIAGNVTGVFPGIDTVSYTVTSSCGSVNSIAIVTVNPLPGAGIISGPASLCLGTAATYTDTALGGTWSMSNGNAAVTPGGLVTPVSAGADTISYSVTNGCGTTAATQVISIVIIPVAGTITGPANVCVGTAITLADAVAGGMWSTSNGHATVAAGVVTGIVPGADTISYTVTSSCGTAVATAVIAVDLIPSPGIITGPSSVCLGSLITLADTALGGAWSAANPLATVSTGGIVTGIAPGTDTISYTVTNACGSFATSSVITIATTPPTAGIITGPAMVCAGGTITLTDATPGGIWSSSNASATVTGGVVTGLTPGTDTIMYVVSGSCGSATASAVIIVGAGVSAGIITGPSVVCAGSVITLTDATAGGVWSSSNTHAAVTGGVVTGATAGTDTIAYTVTGTCGSVSATQIITISTTPSAGTISGAASVCAGGSITVTDATTGGVWSVSNARATITAAGLVTGVVAGLDTVSYTVTGGCGSAVATHVISVGTVPGAGSISGGASLCPGTHITLTDGAVGGTWSSSNTAVATVSGAGSVTGISSGTATISYTVSNTCGHTVATHGLTVLSPSSCSGLVVSGPGAVSTEELLVAPNPNRGIFTMNLSSGINEEVQVVITNVLGQKVKEFTTTTNKITDLNMGEAAGIYLLTASTANGRHVAKVVVN